MPNIYDDDDNSNSHTNKNTNNNNNNNHNTTPAITTSTTIIAMARGRIRHEATRKKKATTKARGRARREAAVRLEATTPKRATKNNMNYNEVTTITAESQRSDTKLPCASGSRPWRLKAATPARGHDA